MLDPALLEQWKASPSEAERVAARIADELAGKESWHPVDSNPVIATRMDVSTNTVRRAKSLLELNGVIMKSRSRFYVT